MTIPKQMKDEIWVKYMGDKSKSECYCCGKNVITMSQFNAGHVIAESHGGATDCANLRPICGSCNSGMGTRNMREYSQEFYPESRIVHE